MKLSIPSAQEVAHSEKLCQFIRAEITHAGGLISFARFMDLALYAPGLGYYSAGKHKFGKDGDFVTAPEISALFTQCIARQCQQIFAAIADADFLEIGAGSGIFAKDLLIALEKSGSLPKHYFILEVSADLRERQKKLLALHCPHLLMRVRWLDSLEHIEINGVIFANEVMDAMPVHTFAIEKGQIKERVVTWREEGFDWQLQENPVLAEQINTLQIETTRTDSYHSEINLQLKAWVQSIAAILKKGVILLADYGYGRSEYYHPDRYMGTLMCYYQHKRHADPLQRVGLQDITAHVDFTTVIEGACDAQCALAGYTTQAAFLFNCGLMELAQAENLTSVAAQFNQAQQIKKLTLPAEMGELIKVMALTKHVQQPLLGFGLHDRRWDL